MVDSTTGQISSWLTLEPKKWYLNRFLSGLTSRRMGRLVSWGGRGVSRASSRRSKVSVAAARLRASPAPALNTSPTVFP